MIDIPHQYVKEPVYWEANGLVTGFGDKSVELFLGTSVSERVRFTKVLSGSKADPNPVKMPPWYFFTVTKDFHNEKTV